MGAQSFLSRQASAKATEVNGRASSGFADKLAATEALLREAGWDDARIAALQPSNRITPE